MTLSYVWHDAFICDTWRIPLRDASSLWTHDTSHVWMRHGTCMNELQMCHDAFTKPHCSVLQCAVCSSNRAFSEKLRMLFPTHRIVRARALILSWCTLRETSVYCQIASFQRRSTWHHLKTPSYDTILRHRVKILSQDAILRHHLKTPS